MRRRLLLLLVLLLPASAFGQGARHDSIVLGPRGQPVSGATITVCTSAGTGQPCTPLATLYPNQTLTAPSIVASTGAVRSSNVVTITTTAAHGIVQGQGVLISGVADPSFNGIFTVTSVPSSTTFTYSQAGSNVTSGSGTVSAPNPFSADALGNYGFFAPPGTYILTITGPQVQTPITMTVILGCPPGGSGCPAGTVTSVGFSAPTQFTVANSPVTSSAVIALGWANALANCVFAGPASGAASTPTCRAMVAADLPVFGASGPSHAAGAVPDPGSVAGTTRFLREDASFAVPTAANVVTAASADVTGLTANKASTNLLTPSANGFYAAYCYTVVTTAAGTSSTLPGCQVNYTDVDSGAAPGLVLSTTNSVNTVGTTGNTPSSLTGFFAKSGGAITYQTFSYASNPANAMVYAVHIRLLGPF